HRFGGPTSLGLFGGGTNPVNSSSDIATEASRLAELGSRLTGASVAMLRAGPPMLVAGPPLAAASQPIPVPVNPLTATAPDRPPRLGTPRRSSADAGLLPDGHSLVETVDLAPGTARVKGAGSMVEANSSSRAHSLGFRSVEVQVRANST